MKEVKVMMSIVCKHSKCLGRSVILTYFKLNSRTIPVIEVALGQNHTNSSFMNNSK